MDCRNIKTNPPEHNGRILDMMLTMQDELAKEYQKIEGITVEYPVNLNVKKNQTILKDFTSRVIEEIAEGHESYELIYNALKDKGDDSMVGNHLQNANEEQADAIAFFMELFLYTGITSEDIVKKAREFFNLDLKSDMSTVMESGKMMLLRSPHGHLIYKGCSDSPVYHLDKTELTPGFTQISLEQLNANSIMNWEVTYHLNIARNYLKNKPWKRSQQLSDEKLYRDQLITGFIAYCGMLYINGFTPDSIYTLYYKKNQVNKFRQKSNY